MIIDPRVLTAALVLALAFHSSYADPVLDPALEAGGAAIVDSLKAGDLAPVEARFDGAMPS